MGSEPVEQRNCFMTFTMRKRKNTDALTSEIPEGDGNPSGDEYQAFKESYDRQPENGLRLNRRKVTGEEFLTRTPFLLKKIPWIDNGYTYGTGTPAKDPYYYAGLYYLQEPSAMTPANRLSPEPGDYVLDLCAAPGGKATELGAKLNGEGLLLANDISNSRAKALLKNLELMGIPNIYVTSETSEKLAKILPEFLIRFW